MAQHMNLGKLMAPLPLSCLLHGAGIFAIGVLLGFNQDLLAMDVPVAEVVMEVAPEEMPERNVPKAVSLNPFASESVWESLTGQEAKQPVSQENVTAAKSVTGSPAASAGSQALLAENEAVKGGDGVTAAGTGSSEAAGGSAAAGGDTGHYEAGTAGTEDNAAPVSAAPAESMESIAGRFAARVEACKEYPYMAVKRGLTGAASITVTLSAAGSLENVYISSSSGEGLLDDAALQTVRNACPFAHGAGRSVTLTVPLHFDLQ